MKCTKCDVDIFDYIEGTLWLQYGHSQADYTRVRYYCPNCKTKLEIDLVWQPSVLKGTKVVYCKGEK